MVSHDLHINSCATETSLGGECSISLGIIGESETVAQELEDVPSVGEEEARSRTRCSPRARGSTREPLRRSKRLARMQPRRSLRLIEKALLSKQRYVL
jgi:hypothetical protein